MPTTLYSRLRAHRRVGGIDWTALKLFVYAFKSSTVHGAACLTCRLKILIPDVRN